MENIYTQLSENGFIQLTESAQLWSREGIIREAIVRAQARESDDLLRGWEGNFSSQYYLTFNWIDASEISDDQVPGLIQQAIEINRRNGEEGYV
ncbi:hypothetical protein [Stenotrophomonas sp. PS02301]|uniref:hypothetical protein n=1 Tax=Stenotrophomonas sp. PS02301 TaxID=2991427 RepID=UPI00249B9AAB|nr:hypothetical protein [Stenotrophomonas sp. PS02301]